MDFGETFKTFYVNLLLDNLLDEENFPIPIYLAYESAPLLEIYEKLKQKVKEQDESVQKCKKFVNDME